MATRSAIYPSLAGKRVIVTGGGSGIGAGLVAGFAAQGAEVHFLDVIEADSLALVEAMAGAPVRPTFHRCDLRDADAIAACFAAIGDVQVLVNNAGNDDRHSLDAVTPAYFDDRISINLRHMLFCTKAVTAGMRAAGGGAIINLGSISWHLGLPDLVLYETAKAGIEGMTRALARELGPDGIRVTCVVPGNVKTPRQEKWYTPEGEAEIVSQQCLKGRIEPADVAALILFLASDDARFVTGHEYWIDAGWAMSVASAPEFVFAADAELGEGPVWIAREQALWFVDIKGSRIHRYVPATGEATHWAAPAQPGFIAPIADGRWIAGLKTGLHVFDPQAGDFTLLTRVEDDALGNRLNDGFVDACGRLWFGSMHDAEVERSGALYRYDADGPARMDDDYCITNGPAMSPDGRTLYHTDTLDRLIYAFDVAEDGSLSGKRVFAAISDGYPDGPAVDADGCVWTGLFGGWGILRFSPQGALLEKVEFPVANVTKLAFGGADLKTAYATTAWKGLSPDDRKRQPLAGGLFSFRVATPGLPQHEVAHV